MDKGFGDAIADILVNLLSTLPISALVFGTVIGAATTVICYSANNIEREIRDE